MLHLSMDKTPALMDKMTIDFFKMVNMHKKHSVFLTPSALSYQKILVFYGQNEFK